MQEATRKYYFLMEELKQQILKGSIKPGDKLPSEHQLAAQYQVSRHTVRKALSILESEGYVSPQHGRGTFCSKAMLHTGTSRTVAVITTYLDSYIFTDVIRGIDRVLTGAGYSIILKNTKNSRNLEARYLEELLERDIDGLIIEPSKSQIFCRHLHLYEKLEEYRIPYVFIQGCFQQLAHKPHVLLDDCGGGREVTRYLISQGCRNIVGIFKADDAQGQNRHKGYVKALQEAGILYDPDKVVWFYTEDRTIQPYQQVREMARRRQENYFDAIVCYNDQIAIEAIRALQEEGLSVPGDVLVTGFDNSYLAVNGRVPLTTIEHPKEKLGEMAAGMLLELIEERKNGGKPEGDESSSRTIVIPPKLIVRESASFYFHSPKHLL